ncbi:hypothetical protein FG379_002190 [Cryptosporidium bovis]|uniref:uncharacterized protein n=1 Tax=Cryptosporidium bovis TaxID=310047 RepID=UPI003519E4F6|nr:hypothetical protein FG379_002190 [Cryptosporidium bovis]
MYVDINVVECYLKDKYGVESILDDKKKEILDLIGNKFNNEWKKKLDDFILNIDIRQYFIGKSTKSVESLNFSNVLTMILKFSDCSKSKKQLDTEISYNNESEDNNSDLEKDSNNTSNNNYSNRLYNLTLTTGKSGNHDTHDVILNCIEYEKIKLFSDQSIVPGTKLLLSNNIMIVNSILLLNNNNFVYLGGKVNDMLESWKLNNLLTEYCSRKLINSKSTLNKPPKFVPFINKDTDKKNLIDKVVNAESIYEKSREANRNNNNFNELDNVIEKNLDSIFKSYNDFIININNYRKSNINNKLNIFDKFNHIQQDKSNLKKDKVKKTNNNYDNNDPGAPVKVYRGKFKSEVIDSEAKKFIVSKDAKQNISLFDHLFSKLDISDPNTNKLMKNKKK